MEKFPAARLSDALYWTIWVCLLAMPVVLIVLAAHGQFSAEAAASAFPDLQVSPDLPWVRAVLAIVLGLSLWALFAALLWQLQQLFQLFRRGGALTEAAARRIRSVGVLATVLAVAQVLVQMAQVAVLSSANPPGERVIALYVSSHEIALVIFGGLLLAIGHVLTEAAVAVSENREFV